jgi:hypothetical protein
MNACMQERAEPEMFTTTVGPATVAPYPPPSHPPKGATSCCSTGLANLAFLALPSPPTHPATPTPPPLPLPHPRGFTCGLAADGGGHS